MEGIHEATEDLLIELNWEPVTLQSWEMSAGCRFSWMKCSLWLTKPFIIRLREESNTLLDFAITLVSLKGWSFVFGNFETFLNSFMCFRKDFSLFLTGYLLREVKKADISLPEGDVNPVAPLPKHVMSIMVSYLLMYRHLSFLILICSW